MAVSHVATGSRSAGGTTTVSPSYPSGVAAKVLAIAARVIKPQTATGTAEAGWKQRISVTGGTGTTGADTGQTRIVIDTKILDGSESGSVTFDNASSPNSSHGVIALYSKSATALWDLTNFSSGSDASHGTGRSASGASPLSLQPGDVVLAICGSDTDTATAYTSPAITVSGITFGATTQRLGAGGVTTGNQTGLMIFEATVSSGTASANPSLSLSGGPSNCGPVVFYRLREVEPPTPAGEVTYVDSTTTGDTANTSSRAPAVPNNPLPYDIVLVNLSRWASPNSNPAVTLPDAGWVSLGASTGADGDQRNDRYARRIDDEIPNGTYTFSWSGSQWTTAHATIYRGVDRDVDLTTLAGLPDPQSVIATNSGSTFPALTINNVPEGAALHWHGTSETVSPGHTVPTGWTEVEENDCDVTGYQESVAAGNYTTNASAVGVSSDSNPSSMIALPPEPAPGGGGVTVTPTAISSQETFGTPVAVKTLTSAPTAISSAEAFGTANAIKTLVSVPTGIASAEQFGTPVEVATLVSIPTGIASGEQFGTAYANVAQTFVATGIGSGEQFGVPSANKTLASSATGIASQENFGTPVAVATLIATPTGISTGEAFGTPSIANPLTVSPGGIASGEGFGTPTVQTSLTAAPVAIGSQENFGAPSAIATLTVSPTGISSGEQFGVATANVTQSASATSIPSAEVFGTPTAIAILVSSPTGISSGEAFGSPVNSGSLVAVPNGIPSGESFGSPAANIPITALPVGIASAEQFGTAQAVTGVQPTPSGIPSAEAFGTPVAIKTLVAQPNGIPTQENFGVPVVAKILVAQSNGIPSAETFGTPTASTSLVSAPTGIGSGEQFGTPVYVAGGISPSPMGIPSGEAFGNPTNIQDAGSQTAAPTGIASGEQFGSPTVVATINVGPMGIGSGEQFGTPSVDTVLVSVAVGIESQEALGVPNVFYGLQIAYPVSIPSEEAFGNPGALVTGKPASFNGGRVRVRRVVENSNAPVQQGTPRLTVSGSPGVSSVKM